MTICNHTKIRKVKFNGDLYWLVPSEHEWIEYYLSPLDHYSEDGELTANPFCDISYAIIEDGGEIVRFGNQIGHISDLKEVPE